MKYLILALELAGCTVSQDNIDVAIALCAPNEGLNYIVGNVKSDVGTIVCLNGARFE